MEMWREAQSCLPPPQAPTSPGAFSFGDSPTSHLQFTIPQELVKPRYFLIFLPHTNSELDCNSTPEQASQHDTMHLSPMRWCYHFCGKSCWPAQDTEPDCPSAFPPHSWKAHVTCAALRLKQSARLWCRIDGVLKIRLILLFKAAIYFYDKSPFFSAFYSQRKIILLSRLRAR